MERTFIQGLEAWRQQRPRHALVLRGARQVGKTWLVRDLAERSGLDLVEVNFERNPELARCFVENDPKLVLGDVGLALARRVDPNKSLLFLDEIQAAPSVISKLRWFTEELPELAVVAAGSLLELALGAEAMSVPVGRVTYRHLEPMSFDEYLRAHGQEELLERLEAWSPATEIGAVAHELASRWYERYSMVGGMPAVVASDVERAAPAQCRRLQSDLLAAYRDDFAKYVGRMAPSVLDSTLLAVASQLGRKFVYSRVGDGVKQHQSKRALELLAKAKLVTIATHAAANGVPLAGEVNPKRRKVTFLDIGLAHALLGTAAGDTFPRFADLAPAVRAQLTEQLSSQQLRVLRPGSGDEPALHYWQREGGRPGEIDSLVQVDQTIVPVELKSGAAGAMKSLHQFMSDKQLGLAVRVDTNPPSLQEMDVKTTQGDRATYRLLNIPGYLLWRVHEIVSLLAA